MNVITKERLKELITHIPEDIFIKVIYNNETYSGIILSMEDNNPCTVAIIDVDNAKIRMCTNHNPLNENKELIIDDFTMNSSFSAPSFDKTIVGLLERWEAAWKEINSEWKAPKEIPPLKELKEEKKISRINLIPYFESPYLITLDLPHNIRLGGEFFHQHIDPDTLPRGYKVLEIRCGTSSVVPKYLMERVDDSSRFYGSVVIKERSINISINTYIDILYWQFSLQDILSKPIDPYKYKGGD